VNRTAHEQHVVVLTATVIDDVGKPGNTRRRMKLGAQSRLDGTRDHLLQTGIAGDEIGQTALAGDTRAA